MLSEALASARSTEWPASPARQPLTVEHRIAGGSVRARPIRITPTKPSAPPLLQQLTSLSLLEVIEAGAPVGTTASVEMLFDALEDGDISEAEADALQELVAEFELSASDMQAAHLAFLLALAHRAVDDGRISHDELRELRAVASLLDVADVKVKQVLDRADATRQARLGAGLGPLPNPWPHGEPLRVGDRVAFTGCDETQRLRLEQRAEELGVRVISSVSLLTVMLITDGSSSGGKAAKAQQFGTRRVHPNDFEVLLRHLQPAEAWSSAPSARPATPTQAATPTAAATSPSPSAVRAWAVAAGYEVGVRGRLPKQVTDAYVAAHH